jgi:Ca2+-binding EF-hand superfamily protein
MHRFVTREEVDDIIQQVDRNKDNLIQYEEFIDLITK